MQHCLDPVTALREGHVEMCADRDGKELISRARAIRWIEASVSIGPRIYQLSDGEWFECGATYVESIKCRLRELITDRPELEMLPWRLGEEEEDYNESSRSASSMPGRYLSISATNTSITAAATMSGPTVLQRSPGRMVSSVCQPPAVTVA
ncbi:hypothetical protein Mth01_39600 [Sphaerimonospora thailandensis]|uniref:Uncharacterized protein n=1 Tax=Sphaerimonospora thailandensis TaxID=795644 RepID=A0A8J3R9P2_9ACTN|nr:hypothetical protein Mth01_39600 [Sphaerimonospora thailandensis]